MSYVYVLRPKDTTNNDNKSARTSQTLDRITIIYVTLITKSADSGLIGLKRIPYTVTIMV